MSFFLETVPVDKAVGVIKTLAPPPRTEFVPPESSYERVLSSDIFADIDIPGFDRSVVDGYAVLSADTLGAGESIPAILKFAGRVAMGSDTTREVLAPGSCVYVPTGGEVPRGADAVAMIEYCEEIGNEVLVKRPLAAGENVAFRGEDFSAGEKVLGKGRRLTPRDVGVLAAVGCTSVPVTTIPRIGIISTGNEIVPVTEVPSGSRIRDVNSYLCRAFVENLGGEAVMYGIVRDDREIFDKILGKALKECDAVLISGGSSKDERDLTAGMIRSRGEVLVHGISIAPGKPTIIGKADGRPVIGLPGHPASAFIVLMVIVRHLISAMTGDNSTVSHVFRGMLTGNIPSVKGREEYVRVRITEEGIVPLFGKSGLLNTLVRSDGVVRIPAGSEGIETGEMVEVILW